MDNDMTPQQQRESDILTVCEAHDLDDDAFTAWCDNFHITSDYEEQVDAYTDSYAGCYDTFLSYAEEMFDDTMEVPDHLSAYIDYEKFARDLQYDYWTHEDSAHGVVYIFRNI